MHRRGGCVLGALLLAALSPSVQAATVCTVSAQPVGFGSYDPLSALSTDATGDVSVTCTGLLNLLVSYTIALSKGTSTSYASRQLASGSNRLSYNLFTDVTRLTVWGDGSGGTSTVGSSYLITLLGLLNHHTVYGRIPAGQNAAVASYSDSITVTLTY